MAKKESEYTVKDINLGGIVAEAGSADQYRTGDWRVQKPVVAREPCNKCGLCFIYCPDGCMKQVEDGYFEPDLYYCKGCGICAEECPRLAIIMEEEKESS